MAGLTRAGTLSNKLLGPDAGGTIIDAADNPQLPFSLATKVSKSLRTVCVNRRSNDFSMREAGCSDALFLFVEAVPHESEAQPPVNFGDATVRQSLTALCGGQAADVN